MSPDDTIARTQAQCLLPSRPMTTRTLAMSSPTNRIRAMTSKSEPGGGSRQRGAGPHPVGELAAVDVQERRDEGHGAGDR